MRSFFQQCVRFLAAHELWLAAPAIGAGMVSGRLLPVAVLLAGAFWPIRWAASQRFSRRTSADPAIAVLLLLLPLTLWVSVLPEETLTQVLRLLAGIALYYALVNWAVNPARLRLAACGLVMAGLGLALIAPLAVVWNTQKLFFIPGSLYGRFETLVADTANPNVMAGTLALLLPLSLGLILFSWRSFSWPGRALLAAAALLMGGVLVLTQSRGAMLGLAAAFALLALLRWRWSWLPLLLGAAALLGTLFFLGPHRVLDFLSGATSLNGLEGRVEVWSRAIYMIADFPLTGIGMGAFSRVANLLYPFFLYEPGLVEHAHNLFLQVAVDLGLPGLLAWLGVLGSAVFAAREVYLAGATRLRQGIDPYLRPADVPTPRELGPALAAGLGAGLLAAQAALVLHGLTDAVTWGMVRPAPLVWALWGLASAARIVSREQGRAG